MSVPSKSIDKNKRYAGVKTNDFINKNRPTERTRTAAPSHGWANLGKVNARRIPPPANLPSIKSETGGSSTAFDSIIPSGSSTHGWAGTNHQSAAATTTSTNNSSSVPRPLTPSKQPTQQQLDSITAHVPTISNENDKVRGSTSTSWSHSTNSTGTTTTTANHSDSTPPNLLGLTDFPRLVTQDNNNNKQNKSSHESSVNSSSQGPSFRPANLSSWKEGGGRVQPIPSDNTEPTIAPLLPTTNPTFLQQPLTTVPPVSSSYNRMYSPQSPMWTQNPPRSKATTSTNHSYGHSNRTNDYKTPTILRNKDIDDLSKLNDNVTWASASQEVNYEEKIRFSDDEDNHETNAPIKTRRTTTNSSRSTAPPRSRYIHDDEQHFKQMQEDKNSELINALTVAKQRRDEQERHLRPKSSEDDQKTSVNNASTMSNYSQRTLPSESTSLWNSTTSRTRHDTNDSQQFTMKSWSDQMDSFNYASLHEKSTNNNVEPEETSHTSTTNTKNRRSPSESSTQSPIDQVDHPKHHFPSSTKTQIRKPTILPSKTKRHETIDYFDQDVSTMNTTESFNDWEDTSVEPKYSERRQQDETTKPRTNFSRSSDISTKKSVPPPVPSSTKTSQSVWRHLSPARTSDNHEPGSHESKSSQPKPVDSSNTSYNERRQTERKSRFTAPINTASIPPLMSVRSDLPPPSVSTTTGQSTTNKTFKSSNYSRSHDFYSENNESSWPNDDEYYDDETGYYDTNITSNPRHHSSIGYNSHHRGYTTLGSYGRYRRGGSLRHQQQYSTYSASNSNTAPLNTSGGSKTKKTLMNRTPPASEPVQTPTTTTTKKTTDLPVETTKTVVKDEPVKKASVWATAVEQIPTIKAAEAPTVPIVLASNTEVEPIKDIPVEAPKSLLSTDFDAPIPVENPSTTETHAITTKKVSQKKTYPNQTAPRHRNAYGRGMTDYDSMPMNSQTYYSSSRRGGSNGRMQDLSSVYYYNQSQSRYHNQYNNYSNEHYSTSRSNTRTAKRGSSTKLTNREHQTTKQSSPTAAATTTTATTSNSIHQRHHSSSDNEQKEGEEWETASESSTNMRNGHQETNSTVVKPTTNEIKSIVRDRTPPKKSFSSQRPVSTRHTDRRGHNVFERGNKTSRSLTSHRSTRTTKSTSEETKSMNPPKKDLHRHSLDGYDLNNVAGVVKIETLPAGALEEEGDAFDDGGEEFCVVMSKRGRKEQKAAQLSKQNALDSTETSTKTTPLPSTSNDPDEQLTNEKSTNENSTHRSRGGKSLPPRFNSKSGNTRQQSTTKGDNNMYYYDQNSYYYYNQNQYYDQDAYYNYGNYNSTHRNPSTRRKQQRTNQQTAESNPTEEHLTERKHETNILEKPNPQSTNVMSNIDMWDPHTDHSMRHSKKLIEKPSTHERKFPNEIVPSSTANEKSLPLHQRTSAELPSHSPIAKANETIARTIKPPAAENKSDRDTKTKSSNYEKNDTISPLAPSQLFPKTTFLDYDDKQSIGTVGDDYNQKINSLKTIWDTSDHPSEQLEQTINTMVAMKQQQQQDNNVPSTSSTKADSYGKEAITVSSANITGPPASISSGSTDEGPKKALSSTGSSNNINPGTNYSTNSAPNKNEQKNICTVKPTQQVPPNIQDQVDVTTYPTFVSALPAAISQASLQQQQQQHLLSQAQVNPLHQPHSYPFYDSHLSLPQQPNQQQQQATFNRYQPQNFSYRNTNMYMQGLPPSVPSTNSMYHHTSQGSISAPPQNNTMPPPLANYGGPFLMDHGPHMIGQPQPPPPQPGPPQAYMNNQLMSNRPQAGPYYRTAPQQQLQTPPGPPFTAQDPMGHGGYYPTFFPAPNSNAPPVGHPSAHNIYGQNEGFHPPHPAMFARGGSMDRADHPLMSQQLSRPTNFPSTTSTQTPGTNTAAAQQQGPPPPSGPPPSLLSQNLKAFPPTQQGNSSVNQASFYPPPPAQGNQYARQPMPIGAMNTTNNRQQTQQVPSLMSGLTKTFPTNGNNLNNNQTLFQHRQPLMTPQSNNNRSMYQHHPHYSSYPKPSVAPNDDTMKPKHI